MAKKITPRKEYDLPANIEVPANCFGERDWKTIHLDKMGVNELYKRSSFEEKECILHNIYYLSAILHGYENDNGIGADGEFFFEMWKDDFYMALRISTNHNILIDREMAQHKVEDTPLIKAAGVERYIWNEQYGYYLAQTGLNLVIESVIRGIVQDNFPDKPQFISDPFLNRDSKIELFLLQDYFLDIHKCYLKVHEGYYYALIEKHLISVRDHLKSGGHIPTRYDFDASALPSLKKEPESTPLNLPADLPAPDAITEPAPTTNEGQLRIKWLGTPGEFGAIINALQEGGYIELSGTKEKRAEFLRSHFLIKTREGTEPKDLRKCFGDAAKNYLPNELKIIDSENIASSPKSQK